MTVHSDIISPLPAGAVTLQGPLGKGLKLSIENRLKKVKYSHLVDPFRTRDERDGRWRCEFWGKIVRSTILSWRDTKDQELLALIKATVKDIISTQTADGCISSYPAELQTKDWDIWGRKYILIGLARYYLEIEKDEAVKQAMIRELDYTISQVGPDALKITECGHHNGLAASSLLEPVVLTYRISGEKRFLDYALWIVAQGGSTVNNIFKAILEGVPPRNLGNGKSYEMMSCFEGLAELYRETGNKEYLDSVLAFYQAVRDQEIFITGVAGLKDTWGEFWDEGKLKQTQYNVGALGETCVTTTWIKFCGQVLRLSGDSTVVDEMERTIYNGVLGAMKYDGSWWMHRNPTPLAGSSWKMPAGDQIPGYGEDCCLAQGPKAMAFSSWMAAMQDKEGIIINLYDDGEIKTELNGKKLVLKIDGKFPIGNKVKISIAPEHDTEFTIKLRIPSWSPNTKVTINGKTCHAAPGSYLSIKEKWKKNDSIEVEFDMQLRAIKAFDGCGRIALMRGPIVLAQDSRLGTVDAPVSLKDLDKTVIRRSSLDKIYMECVLSDGSTLCDYASAGNLFEENNTLCVWLKKV